MTSNFRVPRSTYTRRSALQMKSAFDRVLVENQSLFIPSDGSGYTTMSLRQKLMDGLRWLCDNYEPFDSKDPYERKDYQHLKLFTQIKVKEDGILIDYQNRVDKAIKSESIKSNEGTVVENTPAWKVKLTLFVENSHDTILHIKGLFLTPDDMEYCRHFLEDSGLEEFKISKEEIKVVK